MANSKFNMAQSRTNMIQQMLRPWRVLNQRVLDAFDNVPRHHFVPEEYRPVAYSEMRIPLNKDVSMLSPVIEGRILQETRIQADERILLVGAGSGFLAACLGQLGASVVAVDLDAELVAQATARCEAEGYQNIEFITLNIAEDSLDELGTFDVIILAGSLAKVPEYLTDLLNERGRLTAVVGNPYEMSLTVHYRYADRIIAEPIFETELERLVGFEDKPQFIF